MRVYNLIRDLTADAYGGWHFVVALQAGGGLVGAAHDDEPHLRHEPGQGAALKAAGALPKATAMAAE